MEIQPIEKPINHEEIDYIIKNNFDYTAINGIKENLKLYYNNKKFLHDNLFQNNCILKSNELLEIKLTQYEIEHLWEDFKNAIDDFIDKDKIDLFFYFCINYVSLIGFKNNYIIDDFYEDDINIKQGMKFSKSFKFFINNRRKLREFQDLYSFYHQKMHCKKKGYLYLSIHPLDFLSLSDNNKNWDSCFSLYSGDNRISGFSYMNDCYTFIAYFLTDDDNFNRKNDAFKKIEWNSKMWRMLVHLKKVNNEIAIVYNRQYPFYNILFEQKIDEIIQQLLPNNIQTKLINNANVLIDTNEYNNIYNDLLLNTNFKAKGRISNNFNSSISLGGEVKCFNCAKTLTDYNSNYDDRREFCLCDSCWAKTFNSFSLKL